MINADTIANVSGTTNTRCFSNTLFAHSSSLSYVNI